MPIQATSLYRVKDGTRAEGYYYDVHYNIFARGNVRLDQESVTIIARTINVSVARGMPDNESVQKAISDVLGNDITVVVERKRKERTPGFCWFIELS